MTPKDTWLQRLAAYCLCTLFFGLPVWVGLAWWIHPACLLIPIFLTWVMISLLLIDSFRYN